MSAYSVQYELSLKDLLSSKIDEANSHVNKFEGSLNGVKAAAGAVGVALGVAFSVAAISEFGKSIVEAGSKVENARTGLTTLLKDAAGANNVIANTMDDAMKTPFAFEGLLAANKALISAGNNADDARKDVLNLSNAIAATGGGDVELQRMVVNLQQIKNSGAATAQDIKQFAYAGINIYKVLEQAGIKANKEGDKQAVTYDMLSKALEKAHEKGGIYYNGLENMAGNTSVQISNLGDAMFQLKVKMFDDLKPAISAIITGLASLISHLRQGWDWLVIHKDTIKAVVEVLAVASAAYGAYLLVVNASAIGTAILTAGTWALSAAMYANPIGIVIAAIVALTTVIVEAYKHCAKFRGHVWAVWAVIKEVGQSIKDFWLLVGDVITHPFDLNRISDDMHIMERIIMGSGKRIAEAAKKGYSEGIADFAKDQGKGKTVGTLITDKKKTVTGIAPPETKDKAAKVGGQRSVTIHINIKELVHELKVQTTNLTDSSGKIKDMVAQALMSAVNDAQLVK